METIEPQTFGRPRRLVPDNSRLTRAELDYMLELGTI